MKILKVLLASAILVLVACTASATDSKREMLGKLLAQVGQTTDVLIDQLTTVYGAQLAMMLAAQGLENGDKVGAALEKELAAVLKEELASTDVFVDAVFDIYDEHFTVDELKELVEFNESPLGKKVIEITPLATQRSMEVGQKVAEKIGPKLEARVEAVLRSEGLLPPN